MKDLRIPGVLWVIIIAVAIVAIETYMPVEYQLLGEAAIVALFAIAKANALGTKQIEDLIDLLRTVQTQPQATARGMGAPNIVPTVDVEKYEPNKTVRFLLG